MTTQYDEIDLRPYIMTLLQRWWLVALLGLIAGGLALAYSLTRPRTYQSTATILVNRSRATLSLAEQFPTVTEPIDFDSRIDAILSIAHSDFIARNTLLTVGDIIAPDARNLEGLRDRVEVSSNGEAIRIAATGDNPELAAEIANTWAVEVVRAVNLAYSGNQPLDDLQSQLADASITYRTAQGDLEIFLAENPVVSLEAQLEEAEGLLGQLGDDSARRIAYYSQRARAMEQVAVQAQALIDQMEAGGASLAGDLGDALAVLTYRALALGAVPGQQQDTPRPEPARELSAENVEEGTEDVLSLLLVDVLVEQGQRTGARPFDLQLNLADPESIRDVSGNYVEDLTMIRTLAEEEREAAEAMVVELTGEVVAGDDSPELQDLVARVQALRAGLERENARLLELTSERDLAWEAYQALERKRVEIENESRASVVVSVASPAVPPQEPASRGTAVNTLIAGVLGGLVGVVWVLFTQWWRAGAYPNATNAPPDGSASVQEDD